MGGHDRHFAGDPHAMSGAWSPPTSTMNFCEEDYGFTWYIAEFINSLTNLAYVYLALRSMYRRQPGRSTPRVDFMSASLFVLGVGSFFYHASLRQGLQFVDDLSMLLLAWSMLQATLTFRQTPERARMINLGLAVIVPSFSLFYVWSGTVIYHTSAFLFMIAVLTFRTLYLFHRMEPAFPKAKSKAWGIRTWQSILISVFGYILWNIDLEYCQELRALRQRVGLPWAWLFELHGWWHILTAIGASIFMDVAREMQEESGEKKKK